MRCRSSDSAIMRSEWRLIWSLKLIKDLSLTNTLPPNMTLW